MKTAISTDSQIVLTTIPRRLCLNYRQKSGTKSSSLFAVASSFMWICVGQTTRSRSPLRSVTQSYQSKLQRICFMLRLVMCGSRALLNRATGNALRVSKEGIMRRSVQHFLQHAVKSTARHGISRTLPTRLVSAKQALLIDLPTILRKLNLGATWRFAVYILISWPKNSTTSDVGGWQSCSI